MATFDVRELAETARADVPTINVWTPPCSDCLHWNPQVLFRNSPIGQVAGGIKLCHADKMFSDFSCYQDKEANPVNPPNDDDDIPF